MSDTRQGSHSGPTGPSPLPRYLNRALARNIEALEHRRALERTNAPLEDKIADTITRFTGSMRFVYLHLAIFGFWIVANLGWLPFIRPWDPSFVVLAMIASVEAIFLSTFVLITQNRMTSAADKRAELDLQIGLLAEHEVTRLVSMVSDIAARMGIGGTDEEEVEEMKRDVAPETVLDAIGEKEKLEENAGEERQK